MAGFFTTGGGSVALETDAVLVPLLLCLDGKGAIFRGAASGGL